MFPPRLSHLATRAVVLSKLLPTYAQAHQLDEEVASERLQMALHARMLEQLLEVTWQALRRRKPKLDEGELLERVALALSERPYRRGRACEPNPAWSALLLLLDLEAGVASDAARRALDQPSAQQMLADGLDEVGRFLASELTRSP